MSIIGNTFYSLGDWFNGRGSKKQFFNNARYSHRLQKGEIYINTSAPYEIVNSIAEVSIPMHRLSAMLANGVFMLEDVKSGDRDVLPDDLHKLFKKPNPLQSQNEWLKQYLLQLQAYGNQYVYMNRPSAISSIPVTLVNLNPSVIKPVLTGKFYKQVSLDGIIEKYIYCEGNIEDTIETKDIIWNKIGDLDSSVQGKSPVASLKWQVSNTELNYKYLNKLSGASGGLGILSNKKKDVVGSKALTESEQKVFDEAYTKRYGIEDDQQSILVTNADVEFQFTTPETKKMLLIEQNDVNFILICDRLGANINIFKNSTYENMKHGLVSTHNDTIVPYADQLTQSLTEGFGNGVPKGKRIILDYSHTPYLQSDKETEANTYLKVATSLEKLVTSEIITKAEAKIRLDNQFPIKPS